MEIHSRYHKVITWQKKCPYSELFWSAFSHIQTEYGAALFDKPTMRVSRFVHMLKNVCQSVQNHKRIIVKQYFFREKTSKNFILKETSK